MREHFSVVTIRRKDGEYRVPAPDRSEAGAYYTGDRRDALDTARRMWPKGQTFKFGSSKVIHNPKRKGRAMAKRRKSKQRRSPAQVAAFKKMIAARKGRAAAPARKRRRVRAQSKGVTVAKRRRKARTGGKRMKSVRRVGGASVGRASWRASGFRRNPRRSYRRNPGFNVSGIIARLKQGVVDAGMVLGGKVGVRFLGNLAPAGLKDTPIKAAAVQALAAVGLGLIGQRFLGGDKARFLVAGGIAGAGETVLKNLDATKGSIGVLLGDDDLVLGDYVGDDGGYGYSLNAYEEAAQQATRLSAYED